MADFDLSSLKELLGNDDEALKEILRAFLSDYSLRINDLEAGIAENNPEAVRKAAHAMRSVVGNFNLKRAYELATVMESNAKDGNNEGMAEMLAEFRKIIVDFSGWIKREYGV